MSNDTVSVAATWAVIDSATNIVINRVWWDSESSNPEDRWSPPDGTYVIRVDDPADGGVGDSYDSTTKEFSKAATESGS